MAKTRAQGVLQEMLAEQRRRESEGLPPLRPEQLDAAARLNGYRDFEQFGDSITYLATGGAETNADGRITDKMREWFAGATFELGDDVESVFRAVLEDRPISDVRDQIRVERENYQQNNPNEAAMLGLSGGLMAPVSPGAQLSKGVARGAQALGSSRAGRIAQRIATSSPAQAAISGAADTAAYSAFSGSDSEQVAEDAAGGGVVGGVMGWPAKKIGELGARAYASAKGRESVAGVLESANRVLGGGSGGRVFDTFPEMSGLPPDRRRALEYLLKKTQEGNLSVPDFQRALSEFQELGRGEIVSLTDLATRLTPAGKSALYREADVVVGNTAGGSVFNETIRPRQAKSGIFDRLQSDFGATAGEQLTEEQIAAIAANARREARPLYEQADPRVVFSTPNLENYLSDPYVQRAYQTQVPNLERADKVGNLPPRAYPSEPKTPMEIRTLDAVQKTVRKQQGLDRANQQASVDANDLGNLRTLQNRALEDAGRQVPEYQQARRLYAEGMGEDEFEEGMRDLTANSMTPYKVQKKFESLPDGLKRDAYRSGLVEALLRKWRKNPAASPNLARDFQNDETMGKLRVVFPNEDEFNRFRARVEAEAQLAEVANLGGGSQTQPRMSVDREMLDSSGSIAELASPSGALRNFIGAMENRVLDERREDLKRELAPLLFRQGPQNINPTLEQLQALQRMQDDAMRARQYGISALPRGAVAGPLQGLLFDD